MGICFGWRLLALRELYVVHVEFVVGVAGGALEVVGAAPLVLRGLAVGGFLVEIDVFEAGDGITIL